MIILDSSAIVAMLQREPEADQFLAHVQAADRTIVSAVTVFESAIVLTRRRGQGGVVGLLEFLTESRAEVHPFTDASISGAIAAYQRFGKGTGAKAQLNFGDCISYALAKALGAPLLFKGNDFVATDITPCA